MPSDSLTLERRRRLHPISLGFTLISLIRPYVIPAVLVLVFARGEGWERWLIVPFVIVLVTELIRYATLTYHIAADELVIKHGLLSRTERHIPFARVQNIELVQNALHRLFRVAEIRLQTGGAAEVDAHLRVISMAAVDELRGAILASREDAVTVEDASLVLLRLPLSEIALHGLITGRGLIVLAALAGFAFELDIDVRSYLTKLLPATERFFATAVRSVNAALLWAMIFIPAVVVLRLLSAIWAVIRLYDFTLTRTGDGLNSRYGLLTRVSATIPRARVQVLTVEEGLWHRWLRRATVQVDTAGQFARESGQVGSQWVAPIIRREALPPLVRELQPDGDIDPGGWQSAHPRAFARIVRRRFGLLLAAALLAFPIVGPWSFGLIVVPALLSIWHARRMAERLALVLTPTTIVSRSGAWGQRRSMTRYSRVQSVSCTRSPFDRRWQMATLRVDTAGTAAEHRIVIPYLAEDRAREIYDRLRSEVAHAIQAT
jgi:putative membrane protein